MAKGNAGCVWCGKRGGHYFWCLMRKGRNSTRQLAGSNPENK